MNTKAGTCVSFETKFSVKSACLFHVVFEFCSETLFAPVLFKLVLFGRKPSLKAEPSPGSAAWPRSPSVLSLKSHTGAETRSKGVSV